MVFQVCMWTLGCWAFPFFLSWIPDLCFWFFVLKWKLFSLLVFGLGWNFHSEVSWRPLCVKTFQWIIEGQKGKRIQAQSPSGRASDLPTSCWWVECPCSNPDSTNIEMITAPSFNLTIFVKKGIILAIIHRTKNIKYITVYRALITMGRTLYVHRGQTCVHWELRAPECFPSQCWQVPDQVVPLVTFKHVEGL